MEAWIERHGQVMVVHLKGRVEYHAIEPFQTHCVRHLGHDKVVFNFKQLNFVGSVGITELVSILINLVQQNPKGIKFASMGNEFKRLFESSLSVSLPVYDSLEKAITAFYSGEEEPSVNRSSLVVEDKVEATGF